MYKGLENNRNCRWHCNHGTKPRVL